MYPETYVYCDGFSCEDVNLWRTCNYLMIVQIEKAKAIFGLRLYVACLQCGSQFLVKILPVSK